MIETDLTRRRWLAAAYRDLSRSAISHWTCDQTLDRSRRLQVFLSELAATSTDADVGRAFVEYSPRLVSASAAGLVRLDEGQHSLVHLAHIGYPVDVARAWQRIPLNAPLPFADAIRRREPVWLNTLAGSALRYPDLARALEPLGSQSLVVAPLLVHHRPVGALVLMFEEERIFGSDEQRLVLTTADQVALALDRVCQRADAQRAERALRHQAALFATAVHDLKAPLTGIRMSMQLLDHRLASSAGTGVARPEELAQIDYATTRMTALIDELLDLLRPREHAAQGPPPRPTDLVALVRRIAAASLQDPSTSRITVEANPAVVVGEWDPSQLERILANLFENALKYSLAEQTVDVTVTLEGDARRPPTAVLRVRDRGLGIPDEDLPAVFQPFRRGANVATSIGGTGLGLNSVWRIVQQLSGTVEVTSQEGHGSTFTVRLPLRPRPS